ncbi:MAG: hypothetical protein ACYDFT_00735 [Thermoplasmata archaeon]
MSQLRLYLGLSFGRYARAVKPIDRIPSRGWQEGGVVRIMKGLGQLSERLFSFVRIPGVSWISDEAERDVRVVLIQRKISGGRSTARGAWVLELLLTVGRMGAKRQLRFRETVGHKLCSPP